MTAGSQMSSSPPWSTRKLCKDRPIGTPMTG
jgi:hypothetical protein